MPPPSHVKGGGAGIPASAPEEEEVAGKGHQRQGDADGQHQRRHEEEGERPRVVAQVHEVHDDQRELPDRHDDQQRRQDRCQLPDVDHRELERGHDAEHGGDFQIRAGRGVLGRVRPRRGGRMRAHGIRYTTVKMTIHTMSTKCQYRPATSTLAASWTPSRPRRSRTRSVSSHATPMVTWPPWKPVSTKNVEPKRLVWSVRPSCTNSANS